MSCTTDFILRGMDKGFHTGMILVDLQKVKCICNIRKFLFRCWTNKLWSSTMIYVRAAPLPNIYINDLAQALNETGSYLYADDTCIFYQDNDFEKVEKVLKKECLSLCQWFIGNKLSFWG